MRCRVSERVRRGGERGRQTGEGGTAGVSKKPRVECERSYRTCCSHCSNINNGFQGTDAAALGQTQTVEAAGFSGLWTGTVLLLLEALHIKD